MDEIIKRVLSKLMLQLHLEDSIKIPYGMFYDTYNEMYVTDISITTEGILTCFSDDNSAYWAEMEDLTVENQIDVLIFVNEWLRNGRK